MMVFIGSYFKMPKYPIWIVASETHLTCVWRFVGPRPILCRHPAARNTLWSIKCKRLTSSVWKLSEGETAKETDSLWSAPLLCLHGLTRTDGSARCFAG